MRITESQLRKVIREELEKTIDNITEAFYSPDLGQRAGMMGSAGGIPKYGSSQTSSNKSNKNKTVPRAPLGSMPDNIRKQLEKRYSIQRLSNQLSKINKDYVKSVIPANDLQTYASWVGEELKNKLDDLAKKSYNMEPQEAYEEFESLIQQYSPIRAKKSVVGSVTRGLSSFGLGTKTKE